MNWTIIIIVGIAVLALIVFLIARNVKDERSLEKQLDNDYTKPKPKDDDGGATPDEEVLK